MLALDFAPPGEQWIPSAHAHKLLVGFLYSYCVRVISPTPLFPLAIAGVHPQGKLTSMHFYAWKKGLKTGMYYLRTKPRAHAIQFTVDQEVSSPHVIRRTREAVILRPSDRLWLPLRCELDPVSSCLMRRLSHRIPRSCVTLLLRRAERGSQTMRGCSANDFYVFLSKSF